MRAKQDLDAETTGDDVDEDEEEGVLPDPTFFSEVDDFDEIIIGDEDADELLLPLISLSKR